VASSEVDQDQRTERASPKRLQDARDKGQVPRSRDLSAAFVFGAALLIIMSMGDRMAGGAGQWLTNALQPQSPALIATAQLPAVAGNVALKGFLVVAPLLLAGFVAALVAPVLIGGWTFSTQALMPDFSRVSLFKGIGRMFSAQGLAEVGKAVLKAVLIFGVGTLMLWSSRDAFVALTHAEGAAAIGAGLALCLKLLTQLGIGLVVIAGVDVGVQLWSYHRNLRMTREELREESKETEGRPEVKARIRRTQHAMAQRRMMEAVPKADVIVTNPTHYAVALQYSEGKMRAPKVVAKGADEIAARIREIAREHRVPVLSAPPLARALYRACDLGQEIPANLYAAVAQVLTWVYQLKRGIVRPEPHIEVDEHQGKVR
jgi:flagellar biosynthesis protein FlhB